MYDNASAQQPLFGETRRKDKIINAVVAIVTACIVVVTVLMSFLSCLFTHKYFALNPLGIVFCVIILLQLIPQVFVAMWYRRGELEPKFRRMIYYNAFLTILLCLLANLYFFCVGDKECGFCKSTITPTNTSSLFRRNH